MNAGIRTRNANGAKRDRNTNKEVTKTGWHEDYHVTHTGNGTILVHKANDDARKKTAMPTIINVTVNQNVVLKK